ncbi:MAG: hypothetical protein JXC32_15165 [Anaerolineae bacterium]|nr:hypothetical protein [Anaerolineae bacterium]
MLTLAEAWKTTYPDACIGVLTMHGVANPDQAPELDARKKALETSLRASYDGKTRADIKAHPIIEAYTAYYRQFKKTYHVQHQLESVALKGRDIPRTAALVEAMFMAELKHLLLTAGHDLDVVVPPVTVNVADGTESYTGISGEELALKAGDMVIADAEGVLSSIIYGPDLRTRIQSDTRNVLFTVYAPAGIRVAEVESHLETIRDNVRLIEPRAAVGVLRAYTAR